MRSEMIYVIQAGLQNAFKVGYCKKDANKRVKELQTGCPYKLSLLLTFHGSMSDEKRLHLEMFRSRLIGEWFRWNSVLERYLETPIIDDVSDAIDIRLARANSDNKWLIDECDRNGKMILELRDRLAAANKKIRQLKDDLCEAQA